VGVAICCLTFFSSFFLSSVWGIISSPANWIQNLFQLNTGTFFILAFTQNFFNALWQEIIFRAYLQTRLVKVYGAMWGILLSRSKVKRIVGAPTALTVPFEED